jgi:hypothetical protein
MLSWDRYRFDKISARTRNAELVFLHQVGSTGHVVHSAMFGAQNMFPLFFMFSWD